MTQSPVSPAAIQDAFTKQIGWCDGLGSPFTAELLQHVAAEVQANGPAGKLIADWPGDPVADALPLRMAGALHALVLSAAAPSLAACFPPARCAPGALASAVRATLGTHAAAIRRFIISAPQTNEVGRSAVLLGGFLTIAATTRLPLRLLEIGASAGLNLLWDRYHYQLGSTEWGDPASPVRLAPRWQGPPPAIAPLTIATRAGCDLAPVDLAEDEQRLRLRAYVWPDQTDRLARLDAAILLARAASPALARADAATWLDGQLATQAPGCTTVLYHSIMWQYMAQPIQEAIHTRVLAAAATASAAAPLAWLRLEPPRPDARPELTLQIWPGLPQTRLALAHPHGAAVTWLEPAAVAPTLVPPTLVPPGAEAL